MKCAECDINLVCLAGGVKKLSFCPYCERTSVSWAAFPDMFVEDHACPILPGDRRLPLQLCARCEERAYQDRKEERRAQRKEWDRLGLY